jgi:hypothetical protein
MQLRQIDGFPDVVLRVITRKQSVREKIGDGPRGGAVRVHPENS